MLSLTMNYTLLSPCSSSSANACTRTLRILSVRGMRRKPPPPGKPPIVPPAKRLLRLGVLNNFYLVSKVFLISFEYKWATFTLKYFSILFQTREKEWMSARDVRELLWRRHVYNNAAVSLRRVFREEIEAKETEGLGIEALKREEEEEFDKLLAINEQRNEKAARLRKSKERETMLKMEKQILEHIEEELDAREDLVKKHTEEVLDMIERSKNFVTRENLDEKLTEALENPVVYDFAVDLRGQKICNPSPVKYLEGTPPRQIGRIYDVSLGKQEKIIQGEKTLS